MKRMIALLCAVAMIFTLAACGAKDSPEAVVKRFCEALKKADPEAMALCIKDSSFDPEDLNSEDIPEAVMDVILQNAQKITYTVLEATEEETTGTVQVDFTYPDISGAVLEALQVYLAEAFGMALSGASEEELAEKMETILLEKLAEAEPEAGKLSVTFKCVKTEEGWKIKVLPEDVIHVLTGNFAKAIESLADSLAPSEEEP